MSLIFSCLWEIPQMSEDWSSQLWLLNCIISIFVLWDTFYSIEIIICHFHQHLSTFLGIKSYCQNFRKLSTCVTLHYLMINWYEEDRSDSTRSDPDNDIDIISFKPLLSFHHHTAQTHSSTLIINVKNCLCCLAYLCKLW